jgi:hypothetical protein
LVVVDASSAVGVGRRDLDLQRSAFFRREVGDVDFSLEGFTADCTFNFPSPRDQAAPGKTASVETRAAMATLLGAKAERAGDESAKSVFETAFEMVPGAKSPKDSM